MKYVAIVIFFLLIPLKTIQAQQVEGISLEEMPLIELPSRPIRQPGEYGELQYWVNKKDPAPYAGVLVNPEGWSYVLTEYQSLELRALAALEAQRNRDHAYINLKVGELQIELDNLREVSEIKLSARESDLQRCQERTEIILRDQQKQTRRGKILYGLGGAGAGAIIAILLQAFAF